MAKFRKSLHFDELESSESDRKENLVCEDRDLSPPAPKKQRRWQSKPPAKLREYDTEGSNIDNIPEELYVSSISNWLNFVFTMTVRFIEIRG